MQLPLTAWVRVQVASASAEDRDAGSAEALPQAEVSNGLECKLSCTTSKVGWLRLLTAYPAVMCVPQTVDVMLRFTLPYNGTALLLNNKSAFKNATQHSGSFPPWSGLPGSVQGMQYP